MEGTSGRRSIAQVPVAVSMCSEAHKELSCGFPTEWGHVMFDNPFSAFITLINGFLDSSVTKKDEDI